MNRPTRPVALGLATVLHVALVGVLLTGGIRAAPVMRPHAIVVRAVAAPLADAVVVAFPALPSIAVDVAAPAVEIADAVEECPLVGAITDALANDGDVTAGLAARPDATALMVWDGSWGDDSSPALSPIRRIVVDRIRAASAICRETQLTGPRLFIVSNGTNPVAVAIGSGTWRWSQLLT